MAKALMIVLGEWEKREKELWDEINASSSPEFKGRMVDVLVELFYFVNTVVRELHDGMKDDFRDSLDRGGNK